MTTGYEETSKHARWQADLHLDISKECYARRATRRGGRRVASHWCRAGRPSRKPFAVSLARPAAQSLTLFMHQIASCEAPALLLRARPYAQLSARSQRANTTVGATFSLAKPVFRNYSSATATVSHSIASSHLQSRSNPPGASIQRIALDIMQSCS